MASRFHTTSNTRSSLFSGYNDHQVRSSSSSSRPTSSSSPAPGTSRSFNKSPSPYGSDIAPSGGFGAYPGSATYGGAGYGAYGGGAGYGGGSAGGYGGGSAGYGGDAAASGDGFRSATPDRRGQYSDAVLSGLESQNDEQVSVLSGKVAMLKDITLRIGDEIRDSTALAEKMNDQFGNTSVRLKGTMNRMLRMAQRTGVGWRVWLGFFAAVAVLFWYVWLF